MLLRIVVVLIVLTALRPSIASAQPNFLFSWGEHGAAPGQFHLPRGVAVDGDGFVYVADSGNHRVQKFTSDGVPVAQWGGEGTAIGKFQQSWGIAVLNNAFVYVTDNANHRVQAFDKSGAYLTSWGVEGDSDAQFRNPTDIAVDDFGFVYVADSRGVQKFGGSGTFLQRIRWESPLLHDNPEAMYNGVQIAASGDVFLQTSGRIVKFSPSGEFQRWWGSPLGSGSFMEIEQLQNKTVLAVDPFRGIQVFTDQGMYIGLWGEPGSGPGQLGYPVGIALASNGRIYVSEFFNDRISVFSYEETPVQAVTWSSIKQKF